MSEIGIDREKYREIEALIADAASPVGIDAKKTHVMILHQLREIDARLKRIEDVLETM